MSAAVRDLGVAINWRITLLGLNLAAWLVAALGVAVLFVRHEMTQPPLYPGFGEAVPMFNDLPMLYPARVEDAPVTPLKAIARLPQGQIAGDHALPQRGLGSPERLSSSKNPRALQDALQPPAR